MSIPTWTATPATGTTWQLAEGPVWDAPRDRLVWVDIAGGLVVEGRLRTAGADVTVEVAREHEVGSMAGAVAVAADGALLVAAQEELLVIAPDGTRTTGPRLVPAGAGRRLNDGKPDPAGRFVVGTLTIDGHGTAEQLVRWEHDGSVTVLDDDLALGNGLAWSHDGTTFYSTDSLRHVVHRRRYDPATGAVGPREVFVRVDDGEPDGLTVDAAGDVWIAVWGRGEVRRFTPDGVLTGVLTVPAPHSSCITFAGPDLDVAVVTSARVGLDAAALARHPASGALFTARPGVRGVPALRWTPPRA